MEGPTRSRSNSLCNLWIYPYSWTNDIDTLAEWIECCLVTLKLLQYMRSWMAPNRAEGQTSLAQCKTNKCVAVILVPVEQHQASRPTLTRKHWNSKSTKGKSAPHMGRSRFQRSFAQFPCSNQILRQRQSNKNVARSSKDSFSFFQRGYVKPHPNLPADGEVTFICHWEGMANRRSPAFYSRHCTRISVQENFGSHDLRCFEVMLIFFCHRLGERRETEHHVGKAFFRWENPSRTVIHPQFGTPYCSQIWQRPCTKPQPHDATGDESTTVKAFPTFDSRLLLATTRP